MSLQGDSITLKFPTASLELKKGADHDCGWSWDGHISTLQRWGPFWDLTDPVQLKGVVGKLVGRIQEAETSMLEQLQQEQGGEACLLPASAPRCTLHALLAWLALLAACCTLLALLCLACCLVATPRLTLAAALQAVRWCCMSPRGLRQPAPMGTAETRRVSF